MVKHAGFTLVEVLVAMVLLSVGVLGAAAGGVLAARLLRDAGTRDEASNRAALLLDSLLADSVVGSGSTHSPRFDIGWSATGDSAVVTIRLPDSARYILRGIR